MTNQMIRLNFQRFIDQPIGCTSPPFCLSCEVGPQPTVMLIFFVLDFYDKQQFVCQPNISKNLFTNIQKKIENKTFNQKKSLTSNPR